MKPLRTDDLPRHKYLPLWAALGLWAAFVGLFTVQSVVVDSARWSVALAHAGSFWLLWALFLPLVVWLTFRFPLVRPRLAFQVCIHLLACAAVVTLSQLAYRTLLTMPPPPNRPESPVADDPKRIGPVGMRSGPDIMIYWMAVSVCVAVAHVRRSQERERRAIELEARLTQAKLQTLRMQINPHFLFNTLNAIATLVHSQPQTADDMITDLSELFRNSLDSLDEQEITLAREMELLGHYLRIEQRRFGDRLLVEEQLAPAALAAYVPTLILQPIVENAIRHGIERQRRPGIITIRAAHVGEELHLTVSDNGPGPGDAAQAGDPSARRGIGLPNTQARLQQLYGEQQSFACGPGETGGWTVKIVLPFLAEPSVSTPTSLS